MKLFYLICVIILFILIVYNILDDKRHKKVMKKYKSKD